MNGMSEGRGTTPPGGRPDDTDRAGARERIYLDPVLQPKGPDLNKLLEAADSEKDRFQFSLREMFVVMLAAAVLLGVGSYLPGEYGATEIAGLAGLGLVLYRLGLVFFEPSRKVFYTAWWVMLSFYVVICVLAVAMGR